MKNALLLIGCLLFVGFALLLLAPTFFIGFEGGFKPQQVSFEPSPDGRFQLVVTKKAAFPANEFVDPSVVILAELRTTTNDNLLDSRRVVLIEDSDFSKPQVQWQTREVRISDFDRRQKQVITLNLQ